jgi:HEAT repeat protein
MPSIQPLLLGLGLLLNGPTPPRTPEVQLAHLREVLHDRQDPRGQNQAALLLVQSADPAAEKIVREGLRQPEETEVFLALATAVRLRQDGRFLDELLEALPSNRPPVRQAVAETLAVLPQPDLVRRLAAVVTNPKVELGVRQTAAWILGRSGRKQAVEVLLEQLGSETEELRRVAALALADLTGQNFGLDAARWRVWWARHKHLRGEQWLELRLAFQTSRAQRLEGDLVRARAQVLRLHQQVHNLLPVPERAQHIRSLLEYEDPAVRALTVVWSLELLPTADGPRQRELALVLLRLSHDGHPDVQRGAVLALGRVPDPAAGERLRTLLKEGPPVIRATALRSLAQQARGTDPTARARQKEVIPLLQKALDDKALEVVVEAAEALGMLGAPEACPVLTGLLRHPSDKVRQAAAQALERVADPPVIDELLKGLEDAKVAVRFSLLGALGRAAGDGQAIPQARRKRLETHLEALLRSDPDPGVRSRAATVLGECAGPAALETLWQVVHLGTEGRVQAKAWDAFVEIIVRSRNPALLHEWDRKLADNRDEWRRVQLLGQVAARWQQRPETQAAATTAQEALVQAQIEQGKWSAAAPLVRDLLGHAGGEAERERRLRWLLSVGQLALKDGNRTEALRAVQEAQAHLAGGPLAQAFEKLQKQADKGE